MSDQKTSFATLTKAEPDQILGLLHDFRADPRKEKINLGVGIYHNEEGKAALLPSVQEAEKRLLGTCKEYLPIEGDSSFIQKTLKLSFGFVDDHLIGFQTPGGTAAIRVAAEFLRPFLTKRVWLSDPTWPNHPQVFEHAGYEVMSYPYYKNGLQFQLMMEAVEKMERGDLILLQLSCHNPSGADLSMEQWGALSKCLRKRGVFPLFDMAYQGFASSLEEDRAPLKLFIDDGHEFFLATSYSKNFALYGERVGQLAGYFPSVMVANKALGQIRRIIRALYSNPPMHGGLIVAAILSDESLKAMWTEEVKEMKDRLKEMRLLVTTHLPKLNFVKEQNGMFSFLPITPKDVETLKEKWAIYLPKSGRISFSGINHQNIDVVVKALQDIL